MAESIFQRLKRRRNAIEKDADPTGGDAFGERRNASAVREELGATRDVARATEPNARQLSDADMKHAGRVVRKREPNARRTSAADAKAEADRIRARRKRDKKK